jgi:hypothetical protein
MSILSAWQQRRTAHQVASVPTTIASVAVSFAELRREEEHFCLARIAICTKCPPFVRTVETTSPKDRQLRQRSGLEMLGLYCFLLVLVTGFFGVRF